MAEQAEITPAEPDIEPAPAPAVDPSPVDLGELDVKPHRLSRRPSDANRKGHYMVLAALVPLDVFEEVGWYRASSDDRAKRLACQDAEAGHLPALYEAIHGGGAILHAVPAMSWPKAGPTKYDRPAPQLRIG